MDQIDPKSDNPNYLRSVFSLSTEILVLSNLVPIWPNFRPNLTFLLPPDPVHHSYEHVAPSRVCQFWAQSRSDRHQKGQSGTFSGRQNKMKSDLKKSRICLFWRKSDLLCGQIWQDFAIKSSSSQSTTQSLSTE